MYVLMFILAIYKVSRRILYARVASTRRTPPTMHHPPVDSRASSASVSSSSSSSSTRVKIKARVVVSFYFLIVALTGDLTADLLARFFAAPNVVHAVPCSHSSASLAELTAAGPEPNDTLDRFLLKPGIKCSTPAALRKACATNAKKASNARYLRREDGKHADSVGE